MAILNRSELPVWLLKKYGSASALATALDVTRQTAHNILSGRTVPSYENCEKLGLTLAFLLQETEGTRGMTNLEDFLRQRNHDRLVAGRMTESELGDLMFGERGTTMMKDLIQAIQATAAQVGAVDASPFEWSDGQSGETLSPLLKLRPVGAQFMGHMFTLPGGLREPRVVFGWVATHDPTEERKLPNQVWRLALSYTAGVLAWNANGEEIMGATSVELAQQIVMHLIEYRDEYLSASRRL